MKFNTADIISTRGSMEPEFKIPEKLYFRIGEVCHLINVQPHVLRYWESEFPMLTPQKNRSGQRVYRRKDVEMVFRIHNLLYEQKFTIAGAKKKLLDESRKSSPLPLKSGSDEVILPGDKYDDEPSDLANPIIPRLKEDSDDTKRSPQAVKLIRLLRHDLEDLLTLIRSDASIKS